MGKDAVQLIGLDLSFTLCRFSASPEALLVPFAGPGRGRGGAECWRSQGADASLRI